MEACRKLRYSILSVALIYLPARWVIETPSSTALSAVTRIARSFLTVVVQQVSSPGCDGSADASK